MKIFVSYTTRDAFIDAKFLSYLDDQLSNQWDVYIDLLHNDSTDKQQRVMNELREADVLLLINSNSAKNSKWVSLEKETAQELAIAMLSCPVLPTTPLSAIRDAIHSLLQDHTKTMANQGMDLTGKTPIESVKV